MPFFNNQWVNITHLFLALLSKWKLILASQIACILLIRVRVGFTTSCYLWKSKTCRFIMRHGLNVCD